MMPSEIENLQSHIANSTTLQGVFDTSSESETAERIHLHRLPEKYWHDKLPFAALRHDRYYRRSQYEEGGEYAFLLFVGVEDAQWIDGGPDVAVITEVTDAAVDICKDILNRTSTHAAGVFQTVEAAVEDVLWPTPAEAAQHGKFIRADIMIKWSRG